LIERITAWVQTLPLAYASSCHTWMSLLSWSASES
jgi:hypothetical protein